MSQISPLQKARAAYAPKLPPALAKGAAVRVEEGAPTTAVADVEKIRSIFQSTFGSPVVTFSAGDGKGGKAVNVGVILVALFVIVTCVLMILSKMGII